MCYMTRCIFHQCSSNEIFNLIEHEELFIELFNLTCGTSSCIFNWCSSEKVTKKDRDDMTLLAKCHLQVFMNGSYLLTHESRFQLDMKVHGTSCIEKVYVVSGIPSQHLVVFHGLIKTWHLYKNWQVRILAHLN